MGMRSAGGTSSGAGTPLRPICSLYAIASRAPRLYEVHLWNTHASTAVAVYLCRLTTAGTPGAAIVVAEHDQEDGAAVATPFNTHSADVALGDDLGYRARLGVNGGVIWTFPKGIRIPPGTANGIGVLPNGTGQVLDFAFVYED